MDKDMEGLKKGFERKGYAFSFFPTGKEAALYLDKEIDKKSVGIGDSRTLEEIGIVPLLSSHNKVYKTDHSKDEKTFLDSAKTIFLTDVYLTSVNGASENGELVLIDGTGNRTGASLFTHKKVIFVFSLSKVEENLDKAIFRARNVAAPMNAKRLGKKTPCAITGKCMDCRCPDRICNALLVYLHSMEHVESEVVLIGEKLGF